MIDGRKEKEYTVPMDIGDMMTTQSSGGNSTNVLLDPSKK